MISVEQFAADTASTAGVAADLGALDQAWLALRGEFYRVACGTQAGQALGEAAEQAPSLLEDLNCNLRAVERNALEIMGQLSQRLTDVGHG